MRKLMFVPLALSACSTTPANNAAAPAGAAVEGAEMKCNAEKLGSFVGREGTAEVGAEIQRASGAKVLRWVRPGMAVTMDFREDRVTVYLNDSNKIERASCG
jgi:hypothetical protein